MVASFSYLLALSSRGENYTRSTSLRAYTLEAFITEETFAKQ